MHRTEGDGYVLESGKRRFKDRALPTYEGTVDTAEYNNAVQEEITNVIEYAGLTLNASAAADRSAGWDQLKEAIFESAAITNAGISDVSLDKLIAGTMNFTVSTAEITFKVDQLLFEDSSDTSQLELTAGEGATNALTYVNGTAGTAAGLDSDGFQFLAASGASYALRTSNTGRGISFTGNDPGSPSAENVRKSIFDASALGSWILENAGTSIYVAAPTTPFMPLTGIPYNATQRMMNFSLRWKNGALQYSAPMNVELQDSPTPGTLTIKKAYILSNIDPDAGSDVEVVVTYDAVDVD